MEEKSLELFADEVRQRCEDGISTSSLMQLISDYILQSALDTQKPAGDALEMFDKFWSFEGYGHTKWYKVIRQSLTGDCGGGDAVNIDELVEQCTRDFKNFDQASAARYGIEWLKKNGFDIVRRYGSALTADNAKRGE